MVNKLLKLLWLAILTTGWVRLVYFGIYWLIDRGYAGYQLLGLIIIMICISYMVMYVMSGFWKEEIKRGKGFWGT